MKETCQRHRRGELAGWVPIASEDGKKWAIAEVYHCLRCDGDLKPRIAAGTIKRTQAGAMLAYGLDPVEVAKFFRTEPPAATAEPVTVPLSCWPFPVSTVYPSPNASAATHLPAQESADSASLSSFPVRNSI